MCQEFELDIEDTIIPKIGFGFAGGIGNTGAVCGAVAGAVMAIGLNRERGKTMEESFQTLAVVASPIPLVTATTLLWFLSLQL